VSLAATAQVSLDGLLEGLRLAVETATGPQALLIVFVYSFLIAVVLPLPSEVVLLADLGDGLGLWSELGLIMLSAAPARHWGA
jgi:membrane protein YqaA with SNARE-associated domain